MTALILEREAGATVSARIDAFVRGDQPLTGLDLYYELERSTPLREFHTMLRAGPKNQTRSGLQQSYGDHNRLLLLGLDRLLAGDVDWYRTRLDPASSVRDEHLAACVTAAAEVSVSPRELVALWLAAALHDCGMLAGSPPSVDVEDGVALSGDILDALCPPDLIELAQYAIRNHDYVNTMFRGEIAVGFIADQTAALDASLRELAVAALGLIQVAGAASLGEGRLTEYRLDIFESCIGGHALLDTSARTRLARLLDRGGESTTAPPSAAADAALAQLPTAARDVLTTMLERTSVLEWHKWVTARPDASPSQLVAMLAALAERNASAVVDHIVVLPEAELTRTIAGDEPAVVRELHNGTRALLVGSSAAT